MSAASIYVVGHFFRHTPDRLLYLDDRVVDDMTTTKSDQPERWGWILNQL